MTAPTFVAEYETSWTTTTSPKTASVTTAVGDVLVCFVISEDSSSTLGTPTGGTGLTWTAQQTYTNANNCDITVYTATATTAQTFTLSVANSGTTHRFGFNCLRFSGSSGIGASNKAQSTGTPSLSLTTTNPDSTIVVASGDWAAIDGATRPAITTAGAYTEQTYATVSGQYTVYGGRYANVGTAGAKTVGWSGPSGQTYSMVAVEVKGSAAAGDTTAPTVPTGVTISGTTTTGFTVTWTASTDAVGVTGYEVQLGGVAYATPTGTSQVVTGRTPNTTYSVRVRARDAAGNWSALTTAVNVTTFADTLAETYWTGSAWVNVGNSETYWTGSAWV